MSGFLSEFEQRIRQLKAGYLASRPQYPDQLAELRALVQANRDGFDVARVSSLLGLPTRPLDAAECLLHRIWLGGALPALAHEAIDQWNAALAQPGVRPWRQWLWVWDAAHLQGDRRFSGASVVNGLRIGRYGAGAAELEVRSLRELARLRFAALLPVLERLVANAYFVNLSDLFRLAILHDCGGIYIDVDTLPYRSAPIFLAKPEVPDFAAPDGQHRSWLNLYRDENAVLVAKRQDRAVGGIVQAMVRWLGELPPAMPPMHPESAAARRYAAQLQEATYGVWAGEIGRSFLAYGELAERCCVLHDPAHEDVLGGIEGMRLTIDALSNAPMPLSESERRSYARCVANLEARGWQLADPLELEQLAEVYPVREFPRMAYPAQLRSRLGNCVYYSFLSTDPALDRMNPLFGRYLLKKNAQRLLEPGFWRCAAAVRYETNQPPEPSRPIGQPHTFIPGFALSEDCKNRIARLLFATSYLEYCSYGNKLNLSFVALQRRQNVDPYLGLVHGMIDAEGRFAGFFTAGTAAEFSEVVAASYYRDEMRAMDEAYDAFVAHHLRDTDLFVASLAIEEAWRGQGLFTPLLSEIGRLARSKGCTRIVLTVWENKSHALAIYLKKGFQPEGVFDYARDLFFDRLHFLSCELDGLPDLAGTGSQRARARPLRSPLAAVRPRNRQPVGALQP